MAICTSCNLYDKCLTNKVKNAGSDFSSIMLVIDYPDRDDDKNGVALAGETGRKLDYFLSKVGLTRNEVYVTYALKCKPLADNKIKKQNIDACRSHLITEIINNNPKIIIAMGKFAYWALTEKKNIKEFRGHFDKFTVDLESDKGTKVISIPVMPTFSPTKSLYKWEFNDYIIHDIQKAIKSLTKKHTLTPVPEYISVRSKKDLKLFYDTLMNDTEYCTVDTETTGLEFFRDKIINVGYCTDKNKIFIIPLLPYLVSDLFHKWTKEEVNEAKQINVFLQNNLKLVLQVLKKVNINSKIKFILQNAKFDTKFLKKYKIPLHDVYFDTLIADSLIDENKMHSLNIACEYRGYDFGAYDTDLWPYIGKDTKHRKSYQHVPVPLLEKYLSIDIYATKLLYLHQLKELEDDNLLKYFFKQKMPAAKLLEDMEYRGVKFNKQFILETHELLKKKFADIQLQAENVTGIKGINLRSAKQIVDYMIKNKYPFEKAGISKTKSGNYSVSTENLKKFIPFQKYSELPKLIITNSVYSKISGTYVAGNIQTGEDGGFLVHLDKEDKIHTSYNIATARTGRLSSSSPGLQTFPRPVKGLPNIRQFIIPSEPDWKLFECDFQSLEVNVSAVVFKDSVLINELQNGIDIHSKNTVDMGNILKTNPPDVTYEHILAYNGKGDHLPNKQELLDFLKTKYPNIDFKDKRTKAKNVQFGLSYGKTAHTFSSDFNIDIHEAEKMVNAYFNKYKDTARGRQRLVNDGLKNGFITFFSGRKRRIHQAVDWINSQFAVKSWNAKVLKDDLSRQLLNSPIQGGAHDIFEQGKLRLVEQFKKHNLQARLLLTIHDGIVGECPPEETQIVLDLMKKYMPSVFFKGTELELKLDVDCDLYEFEWYGKKLI